MLGRFQHSPLLSRFTTYSVHPDVLFGFLAYQFPCHVALTAHEVLALDEQLCPTWDSLLGIAKATNHLITLLPVDVVLSMEKGELSWEQKGIYSLLPELYFGISNFFLQTLLFASCVCMSSSYTFFFLSYCPSSHHDLLEACTT